MKRRPDDPSPLWLLLGIPACVLSIAAGIWLLNEEAKRRIDARQADRLIIEQHNAQSAPTQDDR